MLAALPLLVAMAAISPRPATHLATRSPVWAMQASPPSTPLAGPRTYADAVDGARAALRLARTAGARRIKVGLPVLPPGCTLDEVLRPADGANMWPGGGAQSHRLGLQPVVAPFLRGYDPTFLGMADVGMGVWRLCGGDMTCVSNVADVSFDTFARLCDGDFGAGPTRDEHTLLLLNPRLTSSRAVGQPWQRALREKAVRLVDQGGWRWAYRCRPVAARGGVSSQGVLVASELAELCGSAIFDMEGACLDASAEPGHFDGLDGNLRAARQVVARAATRDVPPPRPPRSQPPVMMMMGRRTAARAEPATVATSPVGAVASSPAGTSRCRQAPTWASASDAREQHARRALAYARTPRRELLLRRAAALGRGLVASGFLRAVSTALPAPAAAAATPTAAPEAAQDEGIRFLADDASFRFALPPQWVGTTAPEQERSSAAHLIAVRAQRVDGSAGLQAIVDGGSRGRAYGRSLTALGTVDAIAERLVQEELLNDDTAASAEIVRKEQTALRGVAYCCVCYRVGGKPAMAKLAVVQDRLYCLKVRAAKPVAPDAFEASALQAQMARIVNSFEVAVISRACLGRSNAGGVGSEGAACGGLA